MIINKRIIYNIPECAVYLSFKLQDLGYSTHFIEPDILSISWERINGNRKVSKMSNTLKTIQTGNKSKTPEPRSDAIDTIRNLTNKIKLMNKSILTKLN